MPMQESLGRMIASSGRYMEMIMQRFAPPLPSCDLDNKQLKPWLPGNETDFRPLLSQRQFLRLERFRFTTEMKVPRR
ncbi:hypothetical protein O9992_19485 [Vibrio lentus]|nr:hypothetical protein [Vibrio lentus]